MLPASPVDSMLFDHKCDVGNTPSPMLTCSVRLRQGAGSLQAFCKPGIHRPGHPHSDSGNQSRSVMGGE